MTWKIHKQEVIALKILVNGFHNFRTGMIKAREEGKKARTLELEAHPALDKLTSKISSLNLERVSQIKRRLVAITGRVQKVGRFEIVRDELEQLLDDD
ncbi:hypothetical protein PanWU01x14_113220 [Parasponia andersonii]|uniref:Uncharacterized protein n=1 Tax=Parasponia andersonii TaxID=3476 RepID=A0A2P5CXQ7_PARAD|nr:hypothetical protein PanWU01x14_113220 [Parasponia andersonii]